MPRKTVETYNEQGDLIDTREVEVPAEEWNARILAKLRALDAKSIRAIRAGETDRLEDLEEEAIVLRQQLVAAEAD